MDELVEFLTARLDEAEARARATGRWMGEAWRVEAMPTGPAGTAWVRGGEGAEGPVMDRFAEFVASNDPAFVLADIAAKRRVIELHHSDRGDCTLCAGEEGFSDDVDGGREWYRLAESHPCRTLRLLAQPFSGHRDYRQEWTP